MMIPRPLLLPQPSSCYIPPLPCYTLPLLPSPSLHTPTNVHVYTWIRIAYLLTKTFITQDNRVLGIYFFLFLHKTYIVVTYNKPLHEPLMNTHPFMEKCEKTRGPWATTLTWVKCCKLIRSFTDHSLLARPVSRQWLKQFLRYLAYKVKMLKFSKGHKNNQFGPQGLDWQDLCRGPLNIAIY